VTWHCRACGQLGLLQVANLPPDPVPAPVLELDLELEPDPVLEMDMEMEMVMEPEPEPEPDPEPPRPPVQEPAPSLLESLRDAWTGEDSMDRAAAVAGVPRDLLESLDAAADQVARETRTPRKGDR